MRALFESEAKKAQQEKLWIIFCTCIFCGLRVISLCIHYLGPSPFGGSLVESPNRYLGNAILVELAVIVGIAMAFSCISSLFRIHSNRLRTPFLASMSAYLILAQFDQEIVRWLGEHITLSFLHNYLRKSDGQMLIDLLKSDLVPSILAFVQMILPIPISLWLWRKPWTGTRSFPVIATLVFMEIALITSPHWLMESEPRWRRICPALVGLGDDVFHNAMGFERPRKPKQAYADLLAYVDHGSFADKPLDSIPEFPLYHATGPGHLNADAFKNLPRNKRPNILYISIESWRGWKSGLVHDATIPSDSPLLDSIIEHQAYYFPYAHSQGFPSVEGALNMQLGVWPHDRKIFLSSYTSIRTKSLTEILKDFGYRTEFIASTEPSFDNLDQWLPHWYNFTEYSPKFNQDSIVVDRLIASLDTFNRNTPFFLHTWTVSTHPPYDLPPGAPEPVPNNTETRYDVNMRFADRQLARLIKHVQQSDLWNNTIIVLVGDHSQLDAKVRNNSSIAGCFGPGFTWVHIALLGGWPGLPAPHRNEETVPILDLAPTLMELLDINAPNHWMGHSLLRPQSREFLSFRHEHVAIHHESERLVFEMGDHDMIYTTLDKSHKIDYALLEGHHMQKSEQPPWPFPYERYRDMIRAYSEILDQDRLFPREERVRGIYLTREK